MMFLILTDFVIEILQFMSIRYYCTYHLEKFLRNLHSNHDDLVPSDLRWGAFRFVLCFIWNLPLPSFLAGRITVFVRISTIITKTKIQSKVYGIFHATDSSKRFCQSFRIIKLNLKNLRIFRIIFFRIEQNSNWKFSNFSNFFCLFESIES